MGQIEDIIKTLHPLELKAILKLNEEYTSINASFLEEELSYNSGQANKTIEWLSSKQLLILRESRDEILYQITDKGYDVLKNGTLEERIIAALKDKKLKREDLRSIIICDERDFGKAFGNLKKNGLIDLDENKFLTLSYNQSNLAKISLIKSLLERAEKEGFLKFLELRPEERELISSISKKKGASDTYFKIIEQKTLNFCFSDLGKSIKRHLKALDYRAEEEINQLTAEMLSDKTFKNKKFRAYDVKIPANRLLIGRANPYAEFIRCVKDKLVSLGFKEFDGSLVESEFWNNDALYMPQFHPARDIKDVYYVSEPYREISLEEPYFTNVKKTHEDGFNTQSIGWKYKFDTNFAKRLILRTHGTVLSARQLINAEIPGKYFGIVRCFRYDQVDATHGADFYQTEGIVLAEEINLKTLLALLELFAKEIAGASEVKYVPAYFPFTEPSIEVHVKHPKLGWFELAGSGILRPEVVKPLGINVPVIAWGIGIDRMALLNLKLNDLRELFTHDIDSVRLRR